MAIGDITLTAAMRANVVSLQSTEALLGRTQDRLSTGKRVNSALDNPTNFFAARGHTQRADQLTGLKDNIGEAIQTVKAADNGVKGVTTLLESIRGVVTQARSALNSTTSATELQGLRDQYNELIRQLNSLSDDSGYKGVNFLNGTTQTLTVNFNEQSSASLTMSGFDGSSSGLAISGGTATGTGSIASADLDTTTDLNNIETTLNTALATLRTEGGKLAANLAILSTRQQFIVDMVNTLAEGSTKLTVADSNEEGANMLMLQTRQQLGTTALSLSAQAAQSVLRLF